MVYHIRPYVTAQSTWSRHSLNVTLSADIALFGTYDRQDYTDYFLDASGRVDVKTNSFFSYNLNYMDLHQDRSNRDSIQGFEPTRYHHLAAVLATITRSTACHWAQVTARSGWIMTTPFRSPVR